MATKTPIGHLLGLAFVLKPGESFIVPCNVKHVQSYASLNKIKLQGETVLITENYGGQNPVTTKQTKVTVLEPIQQLTGADDAP